MILQERIQLLARLGEYMLNKEEEWLSVQDRAYRENAWFIPEFIEKAVTQIATRFLKPELLLDWASQYAIPNDLTHSKNVGIVMAGNIPLVGFHDFLSVFMSGHNMTIKTSSKDEFLLKHLIKKLYEWDNTIQNQVSFAEQLKGCDAYIATGSNNSGRYFDYYFGKYPHIIRRNRTSVAILDGTETEKELELLADDMQLYFGLGCRNITQLHVPEGYDFIPILDTLKKYAYLMDYHKYKHNYDYHLALLIMGNKYYMNNDSIILTENISPFSPVSQVHYRYYTDKKQRENELGADLDIQCIVGKEHIPFGQAQFPGLMDYADGVDTMAFLKSL